MMCASVAVVHYRRCARHTASIAEHPPAACGGRMVFSQDAIRAFPATYINILR